jgi:hypothetical protein
MANVGNGDNGAIDVYVVRVLTVTPSNATIPVGQSAPFSVSETGCTCYWTFVSSNKAVATVKVVGHGQFSVTAVASGSATITVADETQNVFVVPITVP